MPCKLLYREERYDEDLGSPKGVLTLKYGWTDPGGLVNTRRIKAALDPQGILHPGKMLPG